MVELMNLSDRIYFLLGLFCGIGAALIGDTILSRLDRLKNYLGSRKKRHEVMMAVIRQNSSLLEELKTALAEKTAAPKKKRSSKKTATHQQKHVNGIDETTEESVQ